MYARKESSLAIFHCTVTNTLNYTKLQMIHSSLLPISVEGSNVEKFCKATHYLNTKLLMFTSMFSLSMQYICMKNTVQLSQSITQSITNIPSFLHTSVWRLADSRKGWGEHSVGGHWGKGGLGWRQAPGGVPGRGKWIARRGCPQPAAPLLHRPEPHNPDSGKRTGTGNSCIPEQRQKCVCCS